MAKRAERFDAVVIGAGQAGLAASYELANRGLDHVVLERGHIGQAWHDRWDSLCMIIPNEFNALPGFPYRGGDSRGFQTRGEWIADLNCYAERYALPIREGVPVNKVRLRRDGQFSLQTSAGELLASNVVVATGAYQTPRLPPIAAGLPPAIQQIHSGSYRNPAALPAGAVLVVGTGNSGSQIAEELYRAERPVYLSVGYSGFPLRRYRAQDVFWWYYHAQLEQFRGKEGSLESLRGLGNLTGRDGGRALDLRQFARDDVRLLGRIQAVDGATVAFAADLLASLAAVDRLTVEFREAVDAYIKANGIQAPLDDPPLDEGIAPVKVPESIPSLDLQAAGVTSVIWATGYRWDLTWLDLPVLDADGAPRNHAGISPCPGVFFAGMSMSAPLSISIGRVGQEAARIAALIAERSLPNR